jgi:glycogen operon protein
VISQVKLIAEPWDVGEGGYQVGNFPVLWTEWNGKYRDAVRRFWRGDGGLVSEMATRLAGSSDLYEHSGRRPYASINFVTSHDGFTLRDLVSYERKHNEANLEGNADGDNNNLSWSGGHEGPTDDPAIVEVRRRQARNLVATLMLSQGVPMIRSGDELGHTQGGNNNAYCQDNDVSWLQWDLSEEQRDILDFVRQAARLRRETPVLRRRRFLRGRGLRGDGSTDVLWLKPDAREMADADWRRPNVRCLAALLAGDGIDEVGPRGQRIVGDTILVLLNAHDEPVSFKLPQVGSERAAWEAVLRTAAAEGRRIHRDGQRYRLESRALAVFRRVDAPRRRPSRRTGALPTLPGA